VFFLEEETIFSRNGTRACLRCLEEITSVRYSVKDLAYARTLSWLTSAGWGIVYSLNWEIDTVEHRIAPFERAILQLLYGRELLHHRKTLAAVRTMNSIGRVACCGSTITST